MGDLSTWGFIRRRLIRLQPMIVFGSLLGLAVFPFTFVAEGWEGQASLGAVLLCALLGALMIPITPALDVRGWDENYPLNGSQWSLFFEYAANLLYVFVFRFLSTRWLALTLAMPRIGSETLLWPNALYEAICVLVIFPLIVIMGSSERVTGGQESGAVCRFCGRISYPLYLVQFPVALCYIKYVRSGQATAWGSWGWGITAFVVALSLAALAEKYYDRPVRKWLSSRWK